MNFDEASEEIPVELTLEVMNQGNWIVQSFGALLCTNDGCSKCRNITRFI